MSKNLYSCTSVQICLSNQTSQCVIFVPISEILKFFFQIATIEFIFVEGCNVKSRIFLLFDIHFPMKDTMVPSLQFINL